MDQLTPSLSALLDLFSPCFRPEVFCPLPPHDRRLDRLPGPAHHQPRLGDHRSLRNATTTAPPSASSARPPGTGTKSAASSWSVCWPPWSPAPPSGWSSTIPSATNAAPRSPSAASSSMPCCPARSTRSSASAPTGSRWAWSCSCPSARTASSASTSCGGSTPRRTGRAAPTSTKSQLARQMVEVVASWLPGNTLVRGRRQRLHRQAPAQGPARERAGRRPHPLEGRPDASRCPQGSKGRRKKGKPLTTPSGCSTTSAGGLAGGCPASPQRGEGTAGQGDRAVLLVRLGGTEAPAGGAGPRPGRASGATRPCCVPNWNCRPRR